MTITITEKEYNALCLAMTQMQTQLEGASDQNDINDISEALDDLNSIRKKYQKARRSANEFQSVRASIAERYKGKLLPRQIDALTRKVIKNMK